MAVYELSGAQEDCYPGTTVLINRFNIQDQALLSLVEQKLVTGLAARLEKNTAFDHVDFPFYLHLHEELFGDLYDWAGTVRKITISKKGTVFCSAEKIEQVAENIFSRLKQENYLSGLDFDTFINELARLYDDLNMLHPFREGNGRTLRLFITLLVRNSGRVIYFDQCDADLLIIATIQAAQGSIDLLRQVFHDIIDNE